MTVSDEVIESTTRIFNPETESERVQATVAALDPEDTVHVGGVLGGRLVAERADGSFAVVPVYDSTRTQTAFDLAMESCMPVMFFQEIMHRNRAGCRDEMVYEQPGDPEGHPGIRLDVETLCFKHNGLPLSHYARTQLCGHARVPVEFFHRIVAQGEVQLAALNINRCVKQRAVHIRGALQGKFLVRIKNDAVIAVLTDNYGIFDNHNMLDAFVECFDADVVPSLMVSQFWTDGNDIEGTVILPNTWGDLPEQIFGLGIAFKNSNIGKRSMSFRPFVTRKGQAGMTYDKKEVTNGVLEVKHTSGINVESVKEQISRNVPLLINSAIFLRTHLLNSQNIIIPNPREVLASLAIRNGISAIVSREWYRNWILIGDDAAYRLRDAEGDAWQAATDPSAPTVFHLLDSLMETARTQPPDMQITLQALAGHMLIDNLDKTEEELVTHWMSRAIPNGRQLWRSSTGPERVMEYTAVLPGTSRQTIIAHNSRGN